MDDTPIESKTREELIKENKELRELLQDEQEYSRAIRNGEVDALIVSGPSGNQVYTLKEADRPYRVIVEEMKEGTVTLSDEGVILYSNRQFARMLKLPLSKLISTSLYDYVDPSHCQTIRSLLSKRETETKRAEVVFETSDHEHITAYVSFSPMEIENAPVFLGVITDVTNEIELEHQVRQMQKMEALGRLAGGIAHDINNILYPIILNTEMLIDEEESDTLKERSLHEILVAAYRQRDLVKQILAFSRRGEQKLIPVQVRPLIEEALKLMRASLPITVEIKQNIRARCDTVLGDQTQIHQVIMNLFSNAADAIGFQAGTIEVSLDVIHLDAIRPDPELKPGKYLQLAIQDSGHGMTREVIERIFEPFFTTKEQIKGTGMGLSVVHGILKHHGGAITVESEPGKGTRFTVYLPLLDEQYQQPAASAECTSPVKGKKILLVDDEALVLTSVKRSLDRLGYTVDAAKDAQEALQIFMKAPDEFDLVITDHTMPHMTGAEFAGEITRTCPDVPIILCTGYSDIITEQDAKEKGIREVLMKPATAKELNEAICRVLEH